MQLQTISILQSWNVAMNTQLDLVLVVPTVATEEHVQIGHLRVFRLAIDPAALFMDLCFVTTLFSEDRESSLYDQSLCQHHPRHPFPCSRPPQPLSSPWELQNHPVRVLARSCIATGYRRETSEQHLSLHYRQLQWNEANGFGICYRWIVASERR